MFDVSFIELLVIFVVALVVLGPDKLPGAIRTGALWFGRAKRSFNKVRAEIEQQINADDIRRQLHNESILADIEEARKNADKLVKDTQNQLNKAQDGVKQAISTANSPAIAVVTNSAVEGEPTYDVRPDVPAEPAEKKETGEVGGPIAADAAREQDAAEKSGEESTQTAKPAPVQDIYNSPPAGRVTVQAGKLMPAQLEPAAKVDNKDS